MMKKSLLCILLAAILMFSVLPMTASAATSGEYEYAVLDDGTAKIIGYTGDGGSVSIPSTLDGYSVTSIGEEAFWDCSNLTEVSIPGSVTSIDHYAFFSCSTLKNIKVDSDNPNYCSIDGNLYDKSGTALIQYASGKTETSFTVPDTVTLINEDAFAYCEHLSTVIILDSVTSIGEGAFLACKSLTEVTIGNSVTIIGESAFYECTSLTEVTIPDSVMFIGTCTFDYCSSLTKVTIGNSVTSIGLFAFDGCSSLTEVTIGNSVTTIGVCAFLDCTSLTELNIPDSVTSIGEGAFYNCSSLTEVTIPDSVMSIDEEAFGYHSDADWNSVKDDSFTINGYTGSAAEQYANDNGFTFIALDDQPDAILGDVDGDEDVTVLDATFIQRYEAGFNVPIAEEVIIARGDIDGDGEVGVIDATYIQRYDAGFNTPYPIGEPIA